MRLAQAVERLERQRARDEYAGHRRAFWTHGSDPRRLLGLELRRLARARVPEGPAARRWLEHYATLFDTVEVNSTFYRLAKPKAVAGWLEATPPDFVFAVKASQYLTHMKRLTDLDQGIERFYAAIEPLAALAEARPGPVAAARALPARRAAAGGALDALPHGRHGFEFRHESWFCDEVLDLLRWHGVALAIGDHPERPWQPWVTTTDWSFVRFHYGAPRPARELQRDRAARARRARRRRSAPTAFAYFNNDWEGFAVKNAPRLRALLS